MLVRTVSGKDKMKDRLNLFDLTGKKAIVTGGYQGMGKSVAQYFAYYGAEVCLIDLSQKLAETAEELKNETGGVFHYVIADLSTSEARQNAFSEAMEKLGGKLDIMVNCAGISILHKAEEIPYEDYRKVISVNLDAVFELTQMAGKAMLPQESGKIINFASMTSFVAGLNVVPYVASKGGVAQMTKAFSNEWAGRGIQVNAIAPGYIMTQMNYDFFHDLSQSGHIFRRITAGRWGEPEDISAAVLFLASKASDYMTGVVLPVDGGFLAME